MHQAPGGGAPGQVVSTTPHPSVARIIVPEKDGQSYGSGTLIDVNGQHGLVVTNWHVVRDASAEITVVFPDGFRSPAQVVKVDQDWDLAALSVWRPTSAAPVPIAPLAPKPGESLTIAGYGSGDYRAALGVCTQYLAPSERHPYELVEVAAEARQGDSGGPILNERGELAGVLFGSGPGYTSGSYAGRVREFLATVLPSNSGSGQTAIAAVPPPPATNTPPLASSTTSPPANMLPLQPLETTSVANPPQSSPARLAEVGMGFAPPMPLAPTATPVPPSPVDPPVAASPDLQNQPVRPVPLIAESEGRGFEVEPPLTPVEPDSISRWRPRSEDQEAVDPRTAVTPRPTTSSDSRAGDQLVSRSEDQLRRLDADLDDARPITADLDRDSTAAGRLAMVPHSPLPPRQGLPAPEIANASADQLLSAAWQRIGGTSFWDQSKTVLAIVGLLTLLIQFWRFNSHSEPPPEAD